MQTRYGPWVVESTLGVGGMGVVCRARHERTGGIAALKTTEPGSARHRRALRREAVALRQLHHPAIVALIDDGSQEVEPWYAMALLDGRSLGHLLGRAPSTSPPGVQRTWTDAGELPEEGPPSSTIAATRAVWDGSLLRPLRWVAELGHALCHMHALGFVHCDLKPDNVLVVDGRAVLVDFGLVTTRGVRIDRHSLLADARIAGTAAYMSPERARGDEFDARADLYALGCILYAVVAGEPPFVHTSAMEVMMAQIYSAPVPLSERVAGVPPALDALVDALLHKDPRQRPAHAQHVVSVLASVGADVPDWTLPASAPLYHPALRGRQQALVALTGAAETLGRDQPGRALWVVGESGIGKSRLVRALLTELARTEGPVLWVGGCTALQTGGASVASGVPLELFAEILRPIAERAETDPDLAAAIAGPGVSLRPWLPFFEDVPGVRGRSAVAPDSAEAARHRLCLAVCEVLEAAADGAPVVLVLDDLQWADDLSLGALRLLLRSLDRRPWLVLGLIRAESDDRILRDVLATGEVLGLDRLDDEDVRAVVCDILGQDPASEGLLRWVGEHASGNPLFVGECLRAVAADGLLLLDGEGRWTLGAEPGAPLQRPLPDTVDALMAARLDPLSPLGLSLCRAAAVLGRRSPLDLAAEVAGIDPIRAELAADELVRRAIAAPDTGADAIAFVHDRLLERTYGAIPAELLPELHRRAADAIAARSGEPARIGWHRERAGQIREAIGAFVAAADAAVGRLSLAEAEHRYRDAMRLAEGPERARLALALASRVLLAQGRAQQTEVELSAVLEALDGASRSAALMSLGQAVARLGRPREALDTFARALEEAEHLGLFELAAEVCSTRGSVMLRTGQPDEAARLQREAIARLGPSGDPKAITRFEQRLATAYNLLGRDEEALVLLDRAVDAGQRDRDLSAEAAARSARANVLSYLGRDDGAVADYQAALDIQRRIGNRQSQGALLGNWASLMVRQGRRDEAEVQFGEALAIHREVGDTRFQGVVLRSLAALSLYAGRIEEALGQLDASQRALDEVGDRLWVAHCDQLRAQVLRYLREPDGAKRALDRALASYRAMGARVEFADALVKAIYHALAFGGDPEPAAAELRALAGRGGRGSMLARALTSGEHALARAGAGEVLLAGEDPSDLPEDLRRRVEALWREKDPG